MFDHKNQYPVILVPGVASYGEGASAARVAKSMGLECRLVSFGLVSGIWDRACELYAQIFGGRVDYGEAHSKKYGHSRFGKFYSGMTAKDPEKINIIAYGFGAPVARLFIDLLCNGSEEEKGATAPEELSGLFKGGNKGFVHCLVTVAGINSGITLPLALETKIPNFKKHCVKTAVYFENALSNTGYIDPYYKNNELKITQHGFSLKTVTAENGGKTKEVIENLSGNDREYLLECKWINPIIQGIDALPGNMISQLEKKLDDLSKKYQDTFADIENEIINTEKELSMMLDELKGSETDMLGMAELKKFFGGDF